MRIVFDMDHPPGSPVVSEHFIETTPGLYPQFVVSVIQAAPMDVIQYIHALHTAAFPIAGTGWDVITKHPTYPGQTRLAALVGEIVRLNDAPSRAILGV